MIEFTHTPLVSGGALADRAEAIDRLVELSEIDIRPYPDGGEVVLSEEVVLPANPVLELRTSQVKLGLISVLPDPAGGVVIEMYRSPMATTDLIYASAVASLEAIQSIDVLADPTGGFIVERTVTPNPQQNLIGVLAEARIKLAELGT